MLVWASVLEVELSCYKKNMTKSLVIFELIKQISIIGIDLLFYVVKIILICAHSYCLKTKCQRLDF